MDDWTPEPLVAPQTAFEEAENEKRPVIVGYVGSRSWLRRRLVGLTILVQANGTQMQALKWADRYEPRVLQFLQLRCQRDPQREGDPNSTDVWSRSLWPPGVLRHARCPREGRSGHCGSSGGAGLHCLCPSIFNNLQCDTCVFEEG